MKLQVQTWSKLKQPTKYFTTLVNRATFNSQRKLGSAKRLINKTAWVVYLTGTIISTFINSSQDKVSSKIRNLASTSVDIVTWALVCDACGNCWYWSLADLGLPPIDVFSLVQTGDSLHHPTIINTKGKSVRPSAMQCPHSRPFSVQRDSTEMILFFPQDT